MQFHRRRLLLTDRSSGNSTPRKLVIPNLNYTMKNDFVYGFYVCFIIFYIFRPGVLRQRENAPGRRRDFQMKEMPQRGKMDTYVFAEV